MKKIILVKDLCCERCARRLAGTLELSEGIVKAKAVYKKNSIFVEVLSTVTDERPREIVTEAGFEVVSVAPRKGIFG